MVLPFKFTIPATSRLQLCRDPVDWQQSEWECREEVWKSFWRPRGRETLEKGGKASVGGKYSIALVQFVDKMSKKTFGWK